MTCCSPARKETRFGSPTGDDECGTLPPQQAGYTDFDRMTCGTRLRHSLSPREHPSSTSNACSAQDEAMTLNVYASLLEDDLDAVSERLDAALRKLMRPGRGLEAPQVGPSGRQWPRKQASD